jgi:hypothetical protein
MEKVELCLDTIETMEYIETISELINYLFFAFLNFAGKKP